MIKFFGIHWAATDKFYLFPLFAFAIIFIIKSFFLKRSFITFLTAGTRPPLRLLFKTIAAVTGLCFLFIALLQPQWNKKDNSIEQEGRDLLVMLDISRSMLAQDIKPNRLEFIKLKVKALLQKLKFERVGLILFSGSAFTQCPLTADYETFSMFLDQVSVENIASGTTAIDAALEKTIETYRQYGDRKQKLALLITDGEDFSLNLSSVKAAAKKEGIKLFALGAGTPDGAPIPKIDFKGNQIGHETDEKGNVALSRLNETLLTDISDSLDGHYMKATYSDADLDKLVALINQFEKEKFENKTLSTYEDKYPWFLGISWICFALEWIL